MDWDSRYSETEYVYGVDANDFLVSISIQLKIGECLSLAEGEGRNAVFLAKQKHTITAVDSSNVGLNKAKLLAAKHNVSLNTVHCDLQTYNIKTSYFDSIISIFCHVPAELRRKIHLDVVAGLKPGGLFVLEAYTERQLQFDTGGPPTKELMMSLTEIKDELQGLEFILAQEIDREIIEGKYHSGIAAVVQVLARKI